MRPTVILTPEALAETVEYFLQHDAFCFDVETLGPDRGVPSQNQVAWMSLATEGRAVAIPFGHPNGDVLIRKATRKKNKVTGKFDPVSAIYDDPPVQLRPSQVFEALRPLFFSDRIKIAHNATFDLMSIAKYYGGDIVPGPYHDTIVIQWLLNENLKSKGLKDLIERYYDVIYDHENVGKRIEAHPFSMVAHYAFMDAKYTWLLWKRLYPLIEQAGLQRVFNLEQRVLGVLLDMGLEGAPVDVDRLRELDKELSERLVEMEADIYRAAGRKFNLNAPHQKAEVLYSPVDDGGQGLRCLTLTNGGEKKRKAGLHIGYGDMSTAAEVLETFAGNPVVDSLLDHAEVNKLLGTYVRGYLGEPGNPKKTCKIYNGRIHADLVQYGTVTGRFSCREPNLQNIPRPDTELGKKIRGLFCAPPGYKLVVADYGQIEMVLLAHFAGPGALFDGFFHGIDPHTQTAARVFNVPVGKVTKEMRQIAKNLNFAIVYGAGADKVAAMSGITSREAKKILAEHERQFPEIYRFKSKVLDTCRSRRPPHIKTMTGRKRRLPTIFAADFGVRGYAERQAVNSLIQGSAADLIKMAMVRLHGNLQDGMRLILSVHDELVTLVEEDLAEKCTTIVQEAMLGEDLARLLTVPLSADIKVVDRWSEAK